MGDMYATDEDGLAKPTHIVCSSPRMHNKGKGKLQISPNGVDFFGNFDYEAATPVDVYRITPQAGPKDGTTKVRLEGSGFASTTNDDIFSKFGTVGVERLAKDKVMQMAWNQNEWLSSMLLGEGDLASYQHKDHILKDKDSLNTIVV